MNSRAFLLIIGLALGALFLADTATVWARAGGGGSRGSRSSPKKSTAKAQNSAIMTRLKMPADT